MTAGPIHSEPRRLVAEDDRTGRLLRLADRAFHENLAVGPAWNQFQRQRRQRKIVRAVAVLALAIGPAASLMRHHFACLAEVEAPSLVAEHLVAPVISALPSLPPAASERRISPPASPPARPIPVRASSNPTAPRAEVLTDATCRAWSSLGHLPQAVDCFQSISREQSLGSEVALYEAARLSAEGLLDARRALLLLDQHSQRFPNSVLRVEVAWLRVRCLNRAGRLDEALTASEELLDSKAGRPLASKLHLLRGLIYAEARGDCAHAVREYVALLGEPGPAGDEAELQRAQCLERMAQPSEARDAYQRYLTRSDARDAGRARERLLALPVAEPSTKGQP